MLTKARDLKPSTDADAQLYDGFIVDQDKDLLAKVRADSADGHGELSGLRDQRLKEILPRYIARNYPNTLSSEQREAWERFRTERLLDGGENSRGGRFVKRLQTLAAQKDLSQDKRYLLEELQLYAESIMPSEAF